MKKRKYPNRHQYQFFANVKAHPKGLPTGLFPPAGTMERWMRQPHFRDAFEALLAQQDLMHIVAMRQVAMTAAHQLNTRLKNGDLTAVPELQKLLRAVDRSVRNLPTHPLGVSHVSPTGSDPFAPDDDEPLTAKSVQDKELS